MTSNELIVRTFRSMDEIREISEVWRKWQCHPNSALDFYSMILRMRPEIIRPHVLVVYRSNQPVTILVGRIENQRMELKLGYASLGRPRARALVLIYGGLLGEASVESCRALTYSIMDSLHQRDADLASFSFLHDRCPLLKLSQSLPAITSRDFFPSSQPHRSMSVPGGVDELYKRLPSKQRKNQRWQARKFQEAFPGGLDIRCFHDQGMLDQGSAGRTFQIRLLFFFPGMRGVIGSNDVNFIGKQPFQQFILVILRFD